MRKMTLMDWLNSNIVPNQGEVCLAIDSLDIRFGDGENTWTALKGDYFGVKTTNINDAGELIIIYNDGQEQNLGNVKGEKGESGSDGQDGTSITIASIVESTADGGENVVTFSDGQSITIKNGSKGTKGDTGATGQKGADGKTPKKGTDYWTTTDKTEIVNEVVSEIDADIQLPNYVIEEAENVINKVVAVQGNRTFTFAAISDMHFGNHNYTDGVKHACQTIKYIDKQLKLDAVAVLGDYTDGWSQTNYLGAIKDFQDINTLLDDLRIAPNMRIQGNHDYYYEGFNKITRFVNAYSDNVTWGSRAGGYFYRDFDEYKLRIICVNTDIILNEDTYEKNKSMLNCSKEQLDWFVKSINLTIDKNADANNWSVLILSHQPLDWWSNYYAFGTILTAYKNGQKGTINVNYKNNITAGSVSYDFSNGNNSATIIGNIHGHIHNLKVRQLCHSGGNSEGSAIGYMRIATPESCIGRANTSYYGNSVWHEEYSYPKTKNTANETSFIIYVIDLDNNVINSICYGAGYDRLIDYKNLSSSGTFKIVNNLTNVATSNTSSTINSGEEYSATLTTLEGYDIEQIKIIMGKKLNEGTETYTDNDITNEVYDSTSKKITIPSVESDLNITATALSDVVTYTITNKLTNITSSNNSLIIYSGGTYETTLTPDDNYTISSVKITMNNNDITSSAYNSTTGKIVISNVTGNIVIEAIAETSASGYTLDMNLNNVAAHPAVFDEFDSNMINSAEEVKYYFFTIDDGKTQIEVKLNGINIFTHIDEDDVVYNKTIVYDENNIQIRRDNSVGTKFALSKGITGNVEVTVTDLNNTDYVNEIFNAEIPEEDIETVKQLRINAPIDSQGDKKYYDYKVLDGWIKGARFGDDGNLKGQVGGNCTGFIKVNNGDKLIGGPGIVGVDRTLFYILTYNESKELIKCITKDNNAFIINSDGSVEYTVSDDNVKFVRFSMIGGIYLYDSSVSDHCRTYIKKISNETPEYDNKIIESELLQNIRITSQGAIDTSNRASEFVLTNFIKCKKNDTIYIKGMNITKTLHSEATKIIFYDNDSTWINNFIPLNYLGSGTATTDENGITKIDFKVYSKSVHELEDKTRECTVFSELPDTFSIRLNGNQTENTIIVTVNQEIK